MSIGCGSGNTESFLVERGMRVMAVPLTQLLELALKPGGLKSHRLTLRKHLDMLSGRLFDCILIVDVLQHMQDPVPILSRFKELVTPGGVILICVPNFNHVKVWYDHIRDRIAFRQRRAFDKSRLHFTTKSKVRRWLKRSGIEPVERFIILAIAIAKWQKCRRGFWKSSLQRV